MIDAVIYGPTPSITIEIAVRPPPENTFRRPKNWLLFRKAVSCASFTPGIGIAARSLKKASPTRTTSTFFRRLESVNTSLSLFRNDVIKVGII
jgi:hypothetical protein